MATNSSPKYAVTWERLAEFVGDFAPRRREFGSHYQLLRGARDEKALAGTVNRQLTALYNQEATAFSRSLGGGDFKLDAAWKQRELQRKSRVMAKSLKRTFSKERDRIAQLPFAERKAARVKFVEWKDKQLDQLLRQEANFQAQTDIMAHSGSESQKLVDVSKSRVMYFQNLGDRTCDFCIGIASGNPYSIQQATTLGAGAHPNCVCAWTQEWTVDPDVLRNAKRQVEDGEVRVWNGSSRTPVGGKALTKVKKMQVRKGGWRGRRIEQKKVIFQKTGQKVKQPYPAERVFGPDGLARPPSYADRASTQALGRRVVGRRPVGELSIDSTPGEIGNAIGRTHNWANDVAPEFRMLPADEVGRLWQAEGGTGVPNGFYSPKDHIAYVVEGRPVPEFNFRTQTHELMHGTRWQQTFFDKNVSFAWTEGMNDIGTCQFLADTTTIDAVELTDIFLGSSYANEMESLARIVYVTERGNATAAGVRLRSIIDAADEGMPSLRAAITTLRNDYTESAAAIAPRRRAFSRVADSTASTLLREDDIVRAWASDAHGVIERAEEGITSISSFDEEGYRTLVTIFTGGT